MKNRFTLFFGVFAAMALSNAIVPVLPSYADSSSLQGSIFAAYFLGALLSTLPAGILSERFGRVLLIRIGLLITVTSGLLLFSVTAPFPMLGIRLFEGIGAGCFVAAAMSYVNSDPDHERMSGYFMALLNAGLVLGLIVAGWMAAYFHQPAAGILFFSLCAGIPACSAIFLREIPVTTTAPVYSVLLPLVREYRYLWYSSVILIGITGVITSLYPEFSGVSSHIAATWIAIMSVSTIIAVLIVSRFSFPPVSVIRWSAVLMAFGVLITFYSPFGFVIIGVLAGMVMIAQMAFLAGTGEHQGIAMGLFSTTSYLGMAALPFIAGLCADMLGFFFTFWVTALCAVTVALTIGKCACRQPLP